jgi:hypothetical protein
LKERYKEGEEGDKDVSNYWMTLRKRESIGF